MYVKAFAVTPGPEQTFAGRQLLLLGSLVGDEATVELTTFGQLLVLMDATKSVAVRKALHAAGMKTYEVGTVVENVQSCSLCQVNGEAVRAGAVALNAVVAGLDVPFPMRITYSGCSKACADPLLQDIGVVRTGAGFDVFGGGVASGLSPRMARLLHRYR